VIGTKQLYEQYLQRHLKFCREREGKAGDVRHSIKGRRRSVSSLQKSEGKRFTQPHKKGLERRPNNWRGVAASTKEKQEKVVGSGIRGICRWATIKEANK